MKPSKQHQFATIPEANIPRSKFNRSHGYKTTFDSGYLIPIYCDEVLPGDTFNLKMTAFARMATPIVPVMDNIYLDNFFFFVPNRLVWSNFVKFMGERDNPTDSISYSMPHVHAPASTGWVAGTIGDYFGIPQGIADLQHCSLPFRAYNLIWNQWFKDENLQNAVTVRLTDTGDVATDFTLLKRGKRHDYFTSCLPYPQKGSTAVSLPLGTTAPVIGIGRSSQTFNTTSSTVYESNGSLRSYAFYASPDTGSSNSLLVEGTAASSAYPKILTDLSAATAATINDLRQAFQLQRLLERDARGGTRYTEIVRSHFNVISPDARLQRPELLAMGTTNINVHPIAQTSATSGSNPLGLLAGFATASMNNQGFVKSFTEHGYIIGLVSVRTDLNYQEGLERMWSRDDRYDLYWPTLAHLGEQAVLNKEIYAKNDANDDLVFGYQERYAEYRYKPSKITGKFNSNATSPIDIWHLAQHFTSLPSLGDTFIQETPPFTRVMAVNTEPQFKADFLFNIIAARPMPTYSVPGLIDHL